MRAAPAREGRGGRPGRLQNRLSRLLFERGWSDGTLAEATGIGRARVNRLKNRRATPTVGEALRIARALDVPVERIFWLAGPP